MRNHTIPPNRIFPAIAIVTLFFSLTQSVTAAPIPSLVADINPGPMAGSSPDNLTAVGDTLFFIANDGNVGEELWKANQSGVSLVKDIAPGNDPLIPSSLAAFQNKLYFSGNDGASSGEELWVSDGTTLGTFMLKDINPGGNSNPTRMISIGGALYFQADDGVHGFELWKSDGTAGGTVMVKDINPGAGSSSPAILTDVSGTLFFAANDGVHGEELWKSDGTLAGTSLVKDIFPGASGSSLRHFKSIGNTLFFRANDGIHGEELWKSAGSAASTLLVRDIFPGADSSSPASLEALNGQVYFRADNGANGSELWKSDGTEAGTVLVRDIVPGSGNSQPSGMIAANQLLFFNAISASLGRELWITDGSQAGTQLLKDIFPGAGNSSPTWITNSNGTVFFQAKDDTHGAEFWKSNGTSGSTVLIYDIYPGVNDSLPDKFTTVANRLYFTADDGVHGRELWSLSLQNQPPSVEAGGPYSGTEGSPISVSGSVTDDDNQITVLWTANDPACTFSPPNALQTNLTCFDNNPVTLTLEARDWWYAPGTDQATVMLTNAPPQINSFHYSAEPALLGCPVAVTVQFHDPGTADTHTATIDWGEGPSQNMSVNQSADTATAVHVYWTIGRYTIRVTLYDDDGASTEGAGAITVQRGLFLPVIR